MRQPGDPVIWRLSRGEAPEPNDVLRFVPKGDRYLVLEVRGKRILTVMLGPQDEKDHRELEWERIREYGKRRRR
jgi:hypothetical protein